MHFPKRKEQLVQPPPNRWPSTIAAEGILFFGQLLREMFSPASFESFRAFSLDTLTRLIDAGAVLGDVHDKRIPFTSAEPFLEEVKWSLSVDPVIDLIDPQLVSLARRTLNSKTRNIDDINAILHTLHNSLAPEYIDKLESSITEIYEDTGKRNRLRVLTGFYASSLINFGYSRPYLLDTVNEHFFSRDFSRVDRRTLTSFFRRMKPDRRKFSCFTRIENKNFANSLRRFADEIYDLSQLPPHVSSAFSIFPNTPDTRWIRLDVSSLDEYSATNTVDSMLLSIQALNHLGPNHKDYTWDAERFVTLPRSKRGIITRPTSMIFNSVQRELTNKRTLSSTISAVIDQFDANSTARIMNSLNTSAIHRNSLPTDNQLIALWSAVEVLLSDPPEGTARIVHYVSKLTPCIVLRYARRYISAVFDDMRMIYRQKFVRILNKEANTKNYDLHTKFAAIIMLESNDHLRRELIRLVSENPLARHRLYKLWEDMKNPKQFYDMVEAHEKRLRWHLYRIYRTRNSLVHNGRRPRYIESVTYNMYDYFKSAVWTIIRYARQESEDSTLSFLVDKIGIEYEIYVSTLEDLKKSNAFSVKDVVSCMSIVPRKDLRSAN